VLIAVVGAGAFASSATSHPLLGAIALFVMLWAALMWVARRSRGDIGEPLPSGDSRAPRVQTLRHVRIRRAVMAAVTVMFAALVAIGSHRWQNTLMAVVVATGVQWLAVRFVAVIRR